MEVLPPVGAHAHRNQRCAFGVHCAPTSVEVLPPVCAQGTECAQMRTACPHSFYNLLCKKKQEGGHSVRIRPLSVRIPSALRTDKSKNLDGQRTDSAQTVRADSGRTLMSVRRPSTVRPPRCSSTVHEVRPPSVRLCPCAVSAPSVRIRPCAVRPLSAQVLGLVRPQSGRNADGWGRNVPPPSVTY